MVISRDLVLSGYNLYIPSNSSNNNKEVVAMAKSVDNNRARERVRVVVDVMVINVSIVNGSRGTQ